MKKCTYCEHLNNDDSQFCVKCGSKFDIQKNIEQPKKVEIEEVNSLATVSLILGLICAGCLIVPMGLPFGVVISLFAIVTGIVSIVRKPKIARNKAIFGIVAGSIVFVLCIIIFIVAGPVIEMLKEYLTNYCLNNPDLDECLMIEEMLPNLLN